MGICSHDIPERHYHWNTAPIKTCFLRSHQAITKLTTCKNDALVKMALLTLDKQKDLMCWDPFFYGVTCSALGYKLSLQVRHCFRHIHETTKLTIWKTCTRPILLCVCFCLFLELTKMRTERTVST